VTSRRCTILEEGVRELLELHHYTVRIMPVGCNKHYPPAHIVASRGPGETRYIRIRKKSTRSREIQDIETRCKGEIALYRKILSRPAIITGLHCEIWIYCLYDGYHCFEVLCESVREIPRLPPKKPVPVPDTGAL